MFSLGCSCGRRAGDQTGRHGDCFSYVVSIDGVHVCYPETVVEYEDVGTEEEGCEIDSLALVLKESPEVAASGRMGSCSLRHGDCFSYVVSIDGVHVCYPETAVEYEDVGTEEEGCEDDLLALVKWESPEASSPKCIGPCSLLQRRGMALSRLHLGTLLSSTGTLVANSSSDLVTEPDTTDLPHPKSGKYDFIKQIGVDGEGVIDLVRDRFLDQLVVRKKVEYARFMNAKPIEAAILHDILPGRHDNIIRLQAFESYGPEGALYFFDYCPGGDLHQLVDRYREHDAFLPEPFIWQVYQQMASALAFLHGGFDTRRGDRERRGVCHRDIKPSNIFLRRPVTADSAYPDCVLADFGHATLDFATYDPAGTAFWQPPEMPRHSPRGDVYSLGAVIHFLVHVDAPVGELPDGYSDTKSGREAWARAPEARQPIMEFVEEYSTTLVCLMLLALEREENKRKKSSQLLKCVDDCVEMMFPSGSSGSLRKAAQAWPMASWAFDHTLSAPGSYEEGAGTEQYFEMMDCLWCSGSRESSLSSSLA